MKTNRKAAFVVVGTLIIGIVIGMLTGDYIRREGFRKFDRMPPSERASRFFEEMVHPSEAQMETMRPILERYTPKIDAIHKNSFEAIKATVDSMMVEMDTLLTPEQKDGLKKWRERAPGGDGGPPPPPR